MVSPKAHSSSSNNSTRQFAHCPHPSPEGCARATKTGRFVDSPMTLFVASASECGPKLLREFLKRRSYDEETSDHHTKLGGKWCPLEIPEKIRLPSRKGFMIDILDKNTQKTLRGAFLYRQSLFQQQPFRKISVRAKNHAHTF